MIELQLSELEFHSDRLQTDYQEICLFLHDPFGFISSRFIVKFITLIDFFPGGIVCVMYNVFEASVLLLLHYLHRICHFALKLGGIFFFARPPCHLAKQNIPFTFLSIVIKIDLKTTQHPHVVMCQNPMK